MKPNLLAALTLLLFVYSCRHRKVEVAATAKPKAPPAKATTGPGPAVPAGEDWQRALGLSKKELRESKLYSFIGEWYGAPYKYGGCYKSGVDCSCFASLLSEKVYNRTLPRSAAEMFSESEKIRLEEAKQGDLVFFRISGKQVSHVGVYLGGGHFVHSSTSRGVVVNSLDEAYYRKYFFCAGRIRSK
jgi:murein DD-endopeptidase / murein LD-carboxypeptidase